MKRVFICLIILLLAVVPVAARTVELTLHPAKASKPAQKYQLLPKPEEQSDSDASPLYKKAIESLPKNLQISQWVKTPLDELPRKQVQSALQQFKPALQLLEQAAKCKQCGWPDVEAGTIPGNLRESRKIAYILALQGRLQIAEGKYEQAIDTIQTGLSMAQHLGEAPALTQGLVGIAISALMLRPVEDLVQLPNAPNLYWALKSLPKPLVDLTKQIELEMPNLKKRVRLLMNRLDRHVTALQCIEALRIYAAAHDGKFPNALSDITEVPIPSGPATKKPFVYQRTGSKAVLEAPAPKGATAKDVIRYELKLKE